MKKSRAKSSKKKKTVRDRIKHSAVDPKVNLRSRFEDIQDVASYFDQLSDKEKDWMNKFMEEYNNASFKKDNKKNLMKTDKEKRESYGRNNARNRDVYNRLKMNNDMIYIEDLNYKEAKSNEVEETNGDITDVPEDKF